MSLCGAYFLEMASEMELCEEAVAAVQGFPARRHAEVRCIAEISVLIADKIEVQAG